MHNRYLFSIQPRNQNQKSNAKSTLQVLIANVYVHTLQGFPSGWG